MQKFSMTCFLVVVVDELFQGPVNCHAEMRCTAVFTLRIGEFSKFFFGGGG